MLFTSSRVFVFLSKSPKKCPAAFILSMGSHYHRHYANYAAIISHLISSEETHESESFVWSRIMLLVGFIMNAETHAVVQFPETRSATAPIK